jgi:hypothetical protein
VTERTNIAAFTEHTKPPITGCVQYISVNRELDYRVSIVVRNSDWTQATIFLDQHEFEGFALSIMRALLK